MKCQICGKKAKHSLSPDIDVQGLGACEEHLEDMRLAYIVLITQGKQEYREILESFKTTIK